MTDVKLMMIGLLALAISGCSSPNYPTPSARSKAMDTVIEEFRIGPTLIDCTGVGPMKCMLVNDELFYDEIEGFVHEAGYHYTLRVEREQYCDPTVFNDCPADAGIYRYKLIELISKTPADK